MDGELAEPVNAAERDGVRNIEEILNDDVFVDANEAKTHQRQAESCTVRWRGTRALRRRRREDRDGTRRNGGVVGSPRELQQKNTRPNI